MDPAQVNNLFKWSTTFTESTTSLIVDWWPDWGLCLNRGLVPGPSRLGPFPFKYTEALQPLDHSLPKARYGKKIRARTVFAILPWNRINLAHAPNYLFFLRVYYYCYVPNEKKAIKWHKIWERYSFNEENE